MLEVGQTYWRHVLEPGAEPFYATGWSVMSTCGEFTSACLDYWAVDARELARDTELVVIE